MRRPLFLLCFLCACSATPPPSTGGDYVDIARATVIVYTPDGGLCAGAFVSATRIVTAAHCVEEGVSPVVVSTWAQGQDGVTFFDLFRLDTDSDLAVLDSLYPHDLGPHGVLLLRTMPLVPGEEVRAVGHPGMLFWAISSGLVSHESEGTWAYASSPIWHGNSGGPLVDRRGDLIGIASGIAYGQPHLGRYANAAAIERILR